MSLVAGACGSTTPSQPAVVATSAPPSIGATTPAAERSTPTPTATPAADGHARADPGHRSRSADGPARLAGRRPAPSDRGDDRRPVPGASTVGLQRGLHRVAGAGRGRHPALHDGLRREPADRGRSGPQLALLLHRLGGRVEGRLRPCRRLAAGACDASRAGQRQARLQRRRVRLGRLLPPGEQPVRAAQPVHRRQAARPLAKRLGAKTGDYQPIWQFAPDAPLEQRPVGGKISFRYPTSSIRYEYDRKTNTYLRSVSVEGKQKDAATKKRVAPKNVIVMLMRFGPLNDGQPEQASARGQGRRQRRRLDRDQRQDDQGHLAEEVAHRPDEVLQRGRARR